MRVASEIDRIEQSAESSVRSCPACEGAAGTSRGEKNSFQLLSCQSCGTLYTDRLPGRLDAADYDAYYDGGALHTEPFVQRRAEAVVEGFSAYRQTNRLLEIGFGAGALLEAAGLKGWMAEGVEVSRRAIQHAEEKGIKAFGGELFQAEYEDNYFDVVAAAEVLEHVSAPDRLLLEIARVLRPGGLFWATTPHGDGIAFRLVGLRWADVCPPDHLQLFSLRGIKILLRRTGFRRVRVATRGANPAEVWHLMRRRSAKEHGAATERNGLEDAFGREPTERWTKSFPRRALKGMANGVLGISHLGDSLRIRAEK